MILRRICDIGVHIAAFMIVVIMLSIVANAGMRYIFGGGIHLVIELSGFAFLWLIFLSVAGTFLAGGHVTVELLTDALPAQLQHFLKRIFVPIIGVVYVAMIGWAGFVATRELIESGEVSIGTVQFLLWPILAILPLGCLLLVFALLQTIFSSLKNGGQLNKHKLPPTE
jgi:TRAP-type C4-dicarboxylate transport system permease small subunit